MELSKDLVEAYGKSDPYNRFEVQISNPFDGEVKKILSEWKNFNAFFQPGKTCGCVKKEQNNREKCIKNSCTEERLSS